MNHRTMLATLILVLVLGLPAAVAAQSPPAPTVRHQYRVAGLPVNEPAEAVMFVLEFQPGQQTPPHTHPGLLLATVLEGAVSFETEGTTTVYRPGESFSEMPGRIGQATHTGDGVTRVMISIVLPKGAAPSTPHPGGPSPAPPAPTPRYLARADAVIPTGAYDVVQQVLDVVPGAQTPPHTHPGQVFVTVLEGEIIFTSQGATTVHRVGDSFIEMPNVVGQARNAGSGRATVMGSYLLPQGAALSTPAPGMPATGAGGMDGTTTLLAALLAGGVLLVGLVLVGGWRSHRHKGSATNR